MPALARRRSHAAACAALIEPSELVRCPACLGKPRREYTVEREGGTVVEIEICDLCDETGELPAWAARAALSGMPAQA